MPKERFAVSLVKAALLAAALLAGIATEAFAQGSISGRVTSSTTTLGLPNTVVQFYDLNADNEGSPPFATTNATGDYTSPTLPAGTYAVLTQDIHGYINEIWSNIPCSTTCDTNALTAIDVTNSAIPNINFVLDPGGRIAGTVTDSGTGLPIANVRVTFVSADGEMSFTSGITDASGNYISDGGTATGNVFAVTENSQGYQNEAYDDVKCLDCNPNEDGDPIAVTAPTTTTGINFALDPGGRITGTVTDGSVPLANVSIIISDSTGNRVEDAVTDGSGSFSSAGLPAGTYYANTSNSLGFADELYNNFPCPGGSCNPFNGTAISVTVPNATNITFVLAAGGTITGTVTAAVGGALIENAQVSIYTSGGSFITNTYTNSSGVYSILMPAGTYRAGTFNISGFQNQLYNNILCGSGCNPASGSAVNVTAGVTTSSINFALVTGGAISGTVNGAGTPQNNVQVWLYSNTGSFLSSANTNGSGVYTFSGLSDGSYYVRTNVTSNFINQLHSGVTCISCNVASSGGTLVGVTAPGTTTVNFNLVAGGRISGTITNADTSLPIQNVSAQIYNAAGTFLTSFSSDASGNYITSGLPTPGPYYVRTSNSLGFINELFDNIPCNNCTATTGTQIMVSADMTTTGRNFVLAPGGRISGTVTNADTLATIQNVSVQIYNSTGISQGSVNTDASGNYTSFGLLGGTYYLRTFNSLGFVDELFDNQPCTFGSCNSTITSGTQVIVTVPATTTGRNFALAPGGRISGTVTNASGGPLQNVSVQIYNAAGTFLGSNNTNASGVYTTAGLPSGTYYARTFNGLGLIDMLHSGLTCPSSGCNVTAGAAISVTSPSTVTNINFTLSTGITGTVTNAAGGSSLQNVSVDIFNSPGGAFVSRGTTNSSGAFAAVVPVTGTYYARTFNGRGFLDELYNDMPCAYGNCTVTSGTGIPVTGGVTTSGINFALTAAVFTDNPLNLGATMVRAVHITELRQRIDALRVRFGLTIFTWTPPSTLTAGTTMILAQHIIDLRTALSQAYVAASMTPPSSYTDPTLTAGVTIKAAHITEIRNFVSAIE